MYLLSSLYSSSTTTLLYSTLLLSSPKQLLLFFATSTTSLLLLSTTYYPICLSGSEDIKHMMFLHCHVAFSRKQHLLFFLPNLPSPLFVATFPILYVLEAAPAFFCQIFPLLCFADDEIVQVHTLYGI